jgi:hypothetical protein
MVMMIIRIINNDNELLYNSSATQHPSQLWKHTVFTTQSIVIVMKIPKNDCIQWMTLFEMFLIPIKCCCVVYNIIALKKGVSVRIVWHFMVIVVIITHIWNRPVRNMTVCFELFDWTNSLEGREEEKPFLKDLYLHSLL